MNKENFKVQKLADFGSSEPWVARIWMSFKKFVEMLRLSDAERNKINSALDDLDLALSHAFISLRNIERNISDIKTPLLNTENEYFAFYDKLWTAYKDRFQKFIKSLGFKIGFLFQNDEKFRKGLEEFSKKYNISKDFQNLVIEDRIWLNNLSVFRNNYLQHKTLSKEVEKVFFNLQDAHTYFHNVWTFIEDITVNLFSLKLLNIFMFREIEESKRDAACPIRFEITVNPKYTKYENDLDGL